MKTLNSPSYIVELDSDELYIIGQALHLSITGTESSYSAEKALKSLVNQTKCIFQEPSQHCVFPIGLMAPVTAVYSEKIMYIPYHKKENFL